VWSNIPKPFLFNTNNKTSLTRNQFKAHACLPKSKTETKQEQLTREKVYEHLLEAAMNAGEVLKHQVIVCKRKSEFK